MGAPAAGASNRDENHRGAAISKRGVFHVGRVARHQPDVALGEWDVHHGLPRRASEFLLALPRGVVLRGAGGARVAHEPRPTRHARRRADAH